jgi:hypothetical protein
MATIPQDDVREIWNEMQNRSWSGLIQTLQAHKGKTEGISDYVVDIMLMIARNEERAGKPFPSNADQLYDELNKQIQQTGNPSR